MSFMHSEPLVFFLPRLPLSISRSAASTGHVSTGCNSKRRFFLPSLSFDTHSSHMSSLRHQTKVENPVYFSTISLISFEKHLIPNSNLQFSIFSPFSSQIPKHLNLIVPISSPLRIEDGVKICKISNIWKCKPLIENLNLNFCYLWKLWRTKWSTWSKQRPVKKTTWGWYVLIENLV